MYTLTRVDPCGDLTLVVGEKRNTAFVVCSRAMARASPVFDGMLNGPFMRDKPSDPAFSSTITLENDDTEAFLVVLPIIHGQPNLAPAQVDRQLFCNICILVDRYLMAHLLKPFASVWYTYNPVYRTKWYKPVPGTDQDLPVQPHEVKEHMVIAYKMGDATSFWHCLGFYAKYCPGHEVFNNGKLELYSPRGCNDDLLSEELRNVPGDWAGK